MGMYKTKYLSIESNTPTYPSGLGVITIGNRLKCENAESLETPKNSKKLLRQALFSCPPALTHEKKSLWRWVLAKKLSADLFILKEL